MGYMQHHAIVVTSFDKVKIGEALEHAKALGDMRVTAIVESNINGYHTFCVVPDGSKAGWHESEHGDSCRERLKAWLRAQIYGDGSSSIQWVEVMYGDDEWQCHVVDDGDRLRRARDVEAAADRREG
jgi:hypothetical protein